jgi:DNA repair protein RAD5
MLDANGKPILDLPPRVETELLLDFSEEERDFYQALYTKSKTQFDGFVTEGKVMNKFVQILQLLSQVRICHS